MCARYWLLVHSVLSIQIHHPHCANKQQADMNLAERNMAETRRGTCTHIHKGTCGSALMKRTHGLRTAAGGEDGEGSPSEGR